MHLTNNSERDHGAHARDHHGHEREQAAPGELSVRDAQTQGLVEAGPRAVAAVHAGGVVADQNLPAATGRAHPAARVALPRFVVVNTLFSLGNQYLLTILITELS